MRLLPPLPFQIEFRWLSGRGEEPASSAPQAEDAVEVDGGRVALIFQRNLLAKRYRLFVDRAGRARVTVPRRGSLAEARRFADAHREWLIQQLRRHRRRVTAEQGWGPGTSVLWRGRPVELGWSEDTTPPAILLGSHRVAVEPHLAARRQGSDWRPWVEAHLRSLAGVELSARTFELALQHRCEVKRVSVRSQRSRWGSCSRRGTVSLNWRLVQVPEAVRDYIILHELMHLREMNHSARFWRHVGAVCPDHLDCEAWLRGQGRSLL